MSDSDPKSRKRGDNKSQDSEASRNSSLMEKMMEAIQLEEKLDPKLTLKRFLSIRSVISTSSSSAERQQAAIGTRSQFRSLGAGTCGRVYEVPGTTDIFKAALHPGRDTDQVWDDYDTHVKISETFDALGRDKLQVHVPRTKYFVGVQDKIWWNENLDRFPTQFLTEPSNLLCAERILPLAKPIRDALVDLYAPKNANIAAFKADASNKDCLVRVYLGKRRERPNSLFFQLRNFNLHLDQMEELGLDVQDYASAMGEALAIMHWACRIDGNDVEFVLGSAPELSAQHHLIIAKPLTSKVVSSMARNTSTWDAHVNDFKKRAAYMWILDFNRCKTLSENVNDLLLQLVNSFFRNDPYFPRPYPVVPRDAFLWKIFRDTYESTSKDCFKQKFSPESLSDMPRLFMDMVEAEQRKRKEVELA